MDATTQALVRETVREFYPQVSDEMSFDEFVTEVSFELDNQETTKTYAATN